MAWVYILEGSNRRHYIGSTTDLDRRLVEHRRGHTYSTRRLGDRWAVAATLELPTLPEARQLERKLKAFKRPAIAIEWLRSLS